MGTGIMNGRTLCATLCEVERGVFYASYPDCESAFEAGLLTTYQIGASAADAKQTIERCAHALGYDTVDWTETVVAPLFASHAETVLHEPAATTIAGRGAGSWEGDERSGMRADRNRWSG